MSGGFTQREVALDRFHRAVRARTKPAFGGQETTAELEQMRQAMLYDAQAAITRAMGTTKIILREPDDDALTAMLAVIRRELG
jgi:hypothetical protein